MGKRPLARLKNAISKSDEKSFQSRFCGWFSSYFSQLGFY
ncbi:hypothetical protein SZ54_4225 [Rhizobium sp. UR51a]|nr:hypothetical protein SZ54_4225 [Rhizobium sp. UR51a]